MDYLGIYFSFIDDDKSGFVEENYAFINQRMENQ